MRISELVTMLEQVKNEEGDLEIYAEVDPYEQAIQEIELAEFQLGITGRPDDEPDNCCVVTVWAGGDPRDLV